MEFGRQSRIRGGAGLTAWASPEVVAGLAGGGRQRQAQHGGLVQSRPNADAPTQAPQPQPLPRLRLPLRNSAAFPDTQ